MKLCKICGKEAFKGFVCQDCYNRLQRKRYARISTETDWQYFCRNYKDPRYRLEKYKDFLKQQKKHKGRWNDK